MNGIREAEQTAGNVNGERKKNETESGMRLQNGHHGEERKQSEGAEFAREGERNATAERGELVGGEERKARIDGGKGERREEEEGRGEKERKKACILSIDGGGMRGIIPAKVLCYVEERIREKTGDPNARIADYFDIMAGTSVGGLIATMVCADDGHGRPLFSAHQACNLIALKGKLIFKIPPLKRPFAKLRGILTPRYSVKHMEAILKEHLVREDGREMTLKDTLKPLLVPCYDLSTAGAYVFSRAEAMKADSHDYRLTDICRATSAVPGFFRPAILKSVDGKTSIVGIDGGLVMNNPAAAAVTHVLHNHVEFPHVRSVGDMLVLSLGTGLFERAYKPEKMPTIIERLFKISMEKTILIKGGLIEHDRDSSLQDGP